MDYIRKYCNQLYKMAFQRKSDFAIFKEIVSETPKAIFYSAFETKDKYLNIEESFGKKTLPYTLYHFIFGNNADALVYITCTDLPYSLKSVDNQNIVCNLESLPVKVREQMLCHFDTIKDFDTVENALEMALNKIKEKKNFSSFTLPSDPDYYKNLSIQFFKNQMERELTTNSSIKKLTKI